jgi:hypothetical protein
MWNFMTPSGIATTVVDFTHEFSPLLIGLVGLMWLSVGIIAYLALQGYLAQKTQPEVGTSPASCDQREAA